MGGIHEASEDKRRNMRWNVADRSTFFNLIGAMVMLVGLCSAIFIYWTAGENSSNTLGYDADGGAVYPIMPEDSRKYLRDLELYGGKAAVLTEEFKRWFVGLWHGKSLAWVVAGTTILVSFGFFYAANQKSSHVQPDVANEDHGDRTNS
jgi:hypothetical protein